MERALESSKLFSVAPKMGGRATTAVSIPGSAAGGGATENEIEHACIVSYERWLQLRELNVTVMPVVHQVDNIEWLYRYLNDGATFIGISPSDAHNRHARRKWLLDTHRLMEREGVPLNNGVYTHILGSFSVDALRSLKGLAWSADATTMMRFCNMYRLYLPLDADGNITIETPLKPYYVGTGATERKNPLALEVVRSYLDSLQMEAHYEVCDDRIVIDDKNSIASINLQSVREVMKAAGLRMFIAGEAQEVLEQVLAENYPYLLRSFATIKDTDGRGIRRFASCELR